MDRARSIASVLHHRLQHLALPDLRRDTTWAQRTPATAPPLAHQLAAALDDRARALGEHLTASPEPWHARHLGVLAPTASRALRAEYTRRAGTAAAYREVAGITNPDQAISPEPHRGNPELEAMRKTVLTALEIRDETDILRSLDRAELEARARQGERACAAAPPDVSSQLRLIAQAEADAFRQAVDTRTQHDYTGAASATGFAAQLVAARQRLEAHDARYEQWFTDTHATREAAGEAIAELERRGYAQSGGEPDAQPENEPQLTAGMVAAVRGDAEAVDGAGTSGHRAARCTESPWPSEQPTQENEAAELTKLLARVDQAARRIAAQQAERQATSQYATRMELKAQTRAEARHQAQTWDEAELEL